MRKSRVLFLCTGNSARSQMAEGFLRHYAGDRFEVHSAGLEPKGVHPYTRKVMGEAGVNIDDQYSKSVSAFMGRVHFEYLITVCHHAEENCPTAFLGFGQKLHWAFEDPAKFAGSEAETLAKFREVRDQIDGRIQAWVAELSPV
jgi:arsenate reductase